MSRMQKAQAKGAKQNFWNDLRIKNGVLLKDVAELLNVSMGSVGSWFSGQKIPGDENLKALCNLFGVDPNKGYEEFAKANKEWDSDRGHMRITLCGPEVAVEKTAKTEKTPEYTKSLPDYAFPGVDNTSAEGSDLLKTLYGQISYKDFIAIADVLDNNGDPISYLYGKVDFDLFSKILAIVGATSK